MTGNLIVKSVICVVAAVFFVVINTMILFLKPQFSYAKNDNDNYQVFYLKWVGTSIYMITIIISLVCIYFAINTKILISCLLLTIECASVVCYALCRYKCVTINNDNIKVERLFEKDLNTNFNSIARVVYEPNARLAIKLKRKGFFETSFNSENFRKFYLDLIKHDVKFKTGKIPDDSNHIYLTKYNITIDFPKTMFREFYQSDTFLKNSRYLFSARSLENHEYIEGYIKESTLDIKEFVELISKDLNQNGYKYISDCKTSIGGYNFTLISSENKKDSKQMRYAYLYKDTDNYFVLYADFLKDDENAFKAKMENAIRRSVYEDGKNKIARV